MHKILQIKYRKLKFQKYELKHFENFFFELYSLAIIEFLRKFDHSL